MNVYGMKIPSINPHVSLFQRPKKCLHTNFNASYCWFPQEFVEWKLAFWISLAVELAFYVFLSRNNQKTNRFSHGKWIFLSFTRDTLTTTPKLYTILLRSVVGRISVKAKVIILFRFLVCLLNVRENRRNSRLDCIEIGRLVSRVHCE